MWTFFIILLFIVLIIHTVKDILEIINMLSNKKQHKKCKLVE